MSENLLMEIITEGLITAAKIAAPILIINPNKRTVINIGADTLVAVIKPSVIISINKFSLI